MVHESPQRVAAVFQFVPPACPQTNGTGEVYLQKTLTDAFIARLAAPTTGRTEVADTRCVGLTLRVTSNGVKSWSFRFRARGATSPSRVTLGVYPDIGLGKARKQVINTQWIYPPAPNRAEALAAGNPQASFV